MASNTPSTPAPCKGTVKRSFLFNSVRVKLVGVHPETGIAFYVNNGIGGVFGVRVYPDGRKVLVNPDKVDWIGKHGKAVYLQFRSAFGNRNYIIASRAVYIAWRGKPIPKGMTIDHIDGCSTNNDYRNLRCVSNAINNRDGGFARKLRNKGINPGTSSRQTGGVASAEKGMCIPRWMLLRYFLRMATIKPSITRWRYEHLSKDELLMILYDSNREVIKHFRTFYNIQISFKA